MRIQVELGFSLCSRAELSIQPTPVLLPTLQQTWYEYLPATSQDSTLQTTDCPLCVCSVLSSSVVRPSLLSSTSPTPLWRPSSTCTSPCRNSPLQRTAQLTLPLLCSCPCPQVTSDRSPRSSTTPTATSSSRAQRTTRSTSGASSSFTSFPPPPVSRFLPSSRYLSPSWCSGGAKC